MEPVFAHTNFPAEADLPKLIRDRIPEIIRRRTGTEPKYHVAETDTEYCAVLLKKIVEEAVEVFHTRGVKEELTKELADLRELTLAIMKFAGISAKDLERMRLAKKTQNGGFTKRYVLDKK